MLSWLRSSRDPSEALSSFRELSAARKSSQELPGILMRSRDVSGALVDRDEFSGARGGNNLDGCLLGKFVFGRSSCVTLEYILYNIQFSLQISDQDANQASHCSLRGGRDRIVEKPLVLQQKGGGRPPPTPPTLPQTPSKPHLRFGSKRQFQHQATRAVLPL